MSLEYSCFISYRHCESAHGRDYINQIHEALSTELSLHTDLKVYLDKERLQGGYLYNEALAQSLFRSATMLVVYTPHYFSFDHSYCAREYWAMEQLEKNRLELLRAGGGSNTRGLIIPVVLRGEQRIPSYVSGTRQCHDFTKFTLAQKKLYRHPRYAEIISEMATYISDLCNEFGRVDESAFSVSTGYHLPCVSDIQNWLDEVCPPKQLLPNRGVIV